VNCYRVSIFRIIIYFLKTVDETTQTSINGELGIENMVSHHTEIFYTATKKNRVLIHASMWISLENVMLCEKKPHAKAHVT
jgi:hypothetical protein